MGFSRFHIYSTISHLVIIMVNKNYVRGANIEYKIKKDLESKGYFCLRSAGSHSCVDIACITPTNILLIQVKRSKKALSPNFISSYYDEDIKRLRELTLPDNCIRYLYFWVDRHGLQKYKILPDRLELV